LGGWVIIRDGSGAQVDELCTDLQVVGVATVAWDPVNLRHVIDVGALGSAVPNSVWYYNGTTGTWSTAPVLASVSAGSAPAGAGAFRMGNGSQLCARNAAGLDSELLAWGTDDLPRLAGVRYPPLGAVVPATRGYVLNVAADGRIDVAPLSAIGAITKDATIIDRSATDANGRRWIDFEARGITPLDNTGTVTLASFAEDVYHGDGTVFATSNSEVTLFIELETVTLEQENDSPLFAAKPHKRVYAAYISKNQYNSHWQLGSDFIENTALREGFAITGTTYQSNINLGMSGTTNGDLSVTCLLNWPNASSSAVPNCAWKLRIFGGGRFVP
jgi:hypothetical protein